MGKPFVGKDGRGAEVYVQTGTGRIVDIAPGNSGKSFKVSFRVDGLKYLINGWVGVDDPVLELARAAQDQGREVNFRVESQRKKDIDPTVPISELRVTAEEAKENTVSILASIDGTLSLEAVTIPENDPAPGGRVRATPQDATPANGGGNTGTSRAHATEEPAWKPFNSDGRPNLGSYAVSGIIGAESTARSYLVERGVVDPDAFGTEQVEDEVIRLTQALLEISDATQVSVPSLVKKVDRNATSHARARSVVYDTLKYVPYSGDNLDAWKKTVQGLATARFAAIIDILLESLNESQQGEASAPSAASAPSTPSAPANTAQPQTQQTSQPAPGVAVFPREELDSNAPKASEDTVEALKNLASESQIDNMFKISRLFQWTFGVKRAGDVTDDALGRLVDFYISQDNAEENFRAALDYIWEATGR